MKKIVAAVMALCLLCACAPALASVDQWAPAIPAGYTLTYDYNLTIPQITDHAYNPTWKMLSRYEYFKLEKNETWKVATFMAAGFEIDTKHTMVPVSLTANATYVYPVVTTTLQIVGVMWATVNNGTLTLNMALRDAGGNVYYKEAPTFTVSVTKDQATKGEGIVAGARQVIDIQGELGGAEAALVSVTGMVTYNLDVRKGKIYDKALAQYVEVTYAFPDYWKNSGEWVAYRKGLQPVMNLIPAR